MMRQPISCGRLPATIYCSPESGHPHSSPFAMISSTALLMLASPCLTLMMILVSQSLRRSLPISVSNTLLPKPFNRLTNMNPTLITNDKAVQAAIQYLAKKNALNKLTLPVYVIGTTLCIYKPKGIMPLLKCIIS